MNVKLTQDAELLDVVTVQEADIVEVEIVDDDEGKHVLKVHRSGHCVEIDLAFPDGSRLCLESIVVDRAFFDEGDDPR